ncbi:fructosamine kinase family protein [Methylocapsa polymorpha]|uniref:Fructosamine kinase family protein n=1 Tax=Methylocapsa polymorpha TaxID=3080828 RepID=A0ABZ0HVE4_9HYPH|nr:fructosamine kinase family protein [Methylocapsa sp. RX1]
MNRLAVIGAALIGGELRRVEAVHGGDLSEVLRIALADGREAIVKNGPAPQTEALMLRVIAASGAPAPAVLAASDEALVMELLPAGGTLSKAWVSLGLALARLHATAGTGYGWPTNYAFGPVAIENGWTEDWPRFWAEHRLMTHLAHLPSALARRVEALAAGLPNRLPARPTPALLHGDLWGGNILAAGDRVSGLIDPACYHGHAEVDLAMLGLFDQPGAAFAEAYGALEPDNDERLPIYRLWPALVHLRLFGEGYRPMVERILHATGA